MAWGSCIGCWIARRARNWALKRLNGHAANEPFQVEAFEREYQVLAGLDHPRIIRVFDYGVDEVGPYYAMELLDGQDLRNAAPLPYCEACALLRDVATSLSLLHARRLIHRDLSPSNVRMTPDGHCKLIDFGALASFGSSRLVVGTPPGSVMDGIPKELDTLVLSLLSSDPRARPASAAEVIARLNTIGELAPEGGEDGERLAQSFLLNPRFVGRAALLVYAPRSASWSAE